LLRDLSDSAGHPNLIDDCVQFKYAWLRLRLWPLRLRCTWRREKQPSHQCSDNQFHPETS